MPRTEVVFFANSDGSCPFLQWFDLLTPAVQNKCTVKIERLAERGYELRRPEADLLRDGIYELRASREGVQHRFLYFFYKQREAKVPAIQIERALKAKELYEADPTTHTYSESNE